MLIGEAVSLSDGEIALILGVLILVALAAAALVIGGAICAFRYGKRQTTFPLVYWIVADGLCALGILSTLSRLPIRVGQLGGPVAIIGFHAACFALGRSRRQLPSPPLPPPLPPAS